MTRFYSAFAPQSFRLFLLAVSLATPARVAAQSPADSPAGSPASSVTDGDVEEIVVTSRRLDKARDSIQADLGASRYVFDQQVIDNQPQGPDRGLGQILLQAPGVTQDSYGQVHIRNEHANVQYRLNGILLPEGISGFGQAFDSRFASSIALITGTLPAQYGYRTSGVVNITTKSGAIDEGGDIGIYGGSHNSIQPSFNYGGSSGGFSYYLSGGYMQNDLGIDNPTSARNAIHDRVKQGHGFAYLSQILNPSLRLSAILGTSVGRFEIPNNPGQPPQYSYLGQSSFDSTKLNDYQSEEAHYAILALQYSGDKLNFQVAPFIRTSRIRFYPDVAGNLIFNGSADQSNLRDTTSGLQADGSYSLSDSHTLRAGLFFSAEHSQSSLNSLTFAVDPSGVQTSDIPLTIADATAKTGYLYGIYLQDEWTVTPEFTVNFGARFDRVNSYTHEQQLSPRINMVWKPYEGTSLHAGYARNFTPPPQELVSTPSLLLYQGTVKQPELTQNDPVRAERESYFDAGILQTLFPGFDLGLDSYYKKKRNLLDEGQFGTSLVLSPFNYAEGWSYGFELSASYHQNTFAAYANAALAQEKGQNIVSSQFFFGQSELDYIATHKIHTDHDQKWTISGGVSDSFVNPYGTLVPALDVIIGSGLRRDPGDGTVNPNGAKLPWYTQVNFGIAQNFDSAGWLGGVTLRLDVINLFDESYRLRDGSGVGLGAPQYGPRRAFYAGIRKAF
jgi:outer membrane receptor protein involved in Fe transport